MPQAPASPPSESRQIRRVRAWELHSQGCSQKQIAEQLGVTQGAVSQWLKRAREGGGVDALRHSPAQGRRAALTAEQFAQIPALIARGAQAYGNPDDHWTTRRVAVALKQQFGVSYHPGHVSRLLKRHCPGWRQSSKTRD